jgi:hypothetical protein
MTIALVCVVKLAMFMSPLVIGLTMMNSGCASMRPPATPSAANREIQGLPLKQEETLKEPELKKDPIGESVYIASGLAELGSYLSGGK